MLEGISCHAKLAGEARGFYATTENALLISLITAMSVMEKNTVTMEKTKEIVLKTVMIL